MQIETIKIKILDKETYPEGLFFVDGKSDWMDLRCSENVHINKEERYNIPLGVAIQLPEEYEAYCLPRSSTFKNYGIIMTNSMGVFDSSYCGNNDQWYFLAYATRDTYIEKGSRIAQFRIMKNQPILDLKYVDDLGNPNRGGVGSTGVK